MIKVFTRLHYSICTEKTENWYLRIPKNVCVDKLVKTDTEVLVNSSGIVNQEDKICLLTDVAVPLDDNVIQKETKKKLKYKVLSTSNECGI